MVTRLTGAHAVRRAILHYVFFACAAFLCCTTLTSCQTTSSAVSSDPQIIAKASLNVYRSVISSQDDSRCVFTPTCSRFMEDAIQKHGLGGFLMGIDRLTRCHGLNLKPGTCYEILKDGTLYDPVE